MVQFHMSLFTKTTRDTKNQKLQQIRFTFHKSHFTVTVTVTNTAARFALF